jgi:hypothetical protein
MVQNPKNGVLQVSNNTNNNHKYCKILHQKNSSTLEQSNQSHPSSFVQLTSQHTIFHLGLCLIATSVACAMGPKCEHIGRPASNASSLQTQILQFVWISRNKIHSKINIFHTLALKIVK